MEAFKHAIREETITIVEFQIANIKKEVTERMTKIEARCKELGEECSEIIPRRLFNVSGYVLMVVRNLLTVSNLARMMCRKYYQISYQALN